MQHETDIKLTSRHWFDYVMGNCVGVMGFTAIFYVGLLLMQLFLGILSWAFGLLDIASTQQIGALVSDFDLWISVFFATSLVLIINVLRWDSHKPYARARLQQEYGDEQR